MMLPLHINARFLTQPLSGTQRYAEQVISELDGMLPDGPLRSAKITAWVPPGDRRTMSWTNIDIQPLGRLRGHAWEQSELFWRTRHGWLLNLVSSAPVFHPRQLVALHDAALYDNPGHFSRGYALSHKTLRPLIARRAVKLLTVSEFSRDALSRALGVSANKFEIVPNGADHLTTLASDMDVLERYRLTPRKYVLFVGNEAPHKNLQKALQAYTELGDPTLEFVTVGAGLSAVFGNVSLRDVPGVKRLARIDDRQLKTLYENAALFLFPSRYEGFGIPPLEAMSLGCPVVASTAAAMPEVLGGAALMVDPDDTAGMAAAMRSILRDPRAREEMVRKGFDRSAQFSWRHAASRLQMVLASLMTEKVRR